MNKFMEKLTFVLVLHFFTRVNSDLAIFTAIVCKSREEFRTQQNI